jgi:hypothetical protein
MVDRANSWTIAYGKESGKYIYGMTNFGDANSRAVNINMLPVGTYYLVVKANNGCMPGAFSGERKITVGSNGSVLGTTSRARGSVLGTIFTPKPTATPSVEATITPQLTPSAEPTVAPTQTENLNFFQRLWKFIFG